MDNCYRETFNYLKAKSEKLAKEVPGYVTVMPMYRNAKSLEADLFILISEMLEHIEGGNDGR